VKGIPADDGDIDFWLNVGKRSAEIKEIGGYEVDEVK